MNRKEKIQLLFSHRLSGIKSGFGTCATTLGLISLLGCAPSKQGPRSLDILRQVKQEQYMNPAVVNDTTIHIVDVLNLPNPSNDDINQDTFQDTFQDTLLSLVNQVDSQVLEQCDTLFHEINDTLGPEIQKCVDCVLGHPDFSSLGEIFSDASLSDLQNVSDLPQIESLVTQIMNDIDTSALEQSLHLFMQTHADTLNLLVDTIKNIEKNIDIKNMNPQVLEASFGGDIFNLMRQNPIITGLVLLIFGVLGARHLGNKSEDLSLQFSKKLMNSGRTIATISAILSVTWLGLYIFAPSLLKKIQETLAYLRQLGIGDVKYFGYVLVLYIVTILPLINKLFSGKAAALKQWGFILVGAWILNRGLEIDVHMDGRFNWKPIEIVTITKWKKPSQQPGDHDIIYPSPSLSPQAGSGHDTFSPQEEIHVSFNQTETPTIWKNIRHKTPYSVVRYLQEIDKLSAQKHFNLYEYVLWSWVRKQSSSTSHIANQLDEKQSIGANDVHRIILGSVTFTHVPAKIKTWYSLVHRLNNYDNETAKRELNVGEYIFYRYVKYYLENNTNASTEDGKLLALARCLVQQQDHYGSFHGFSVPFHLLPNINVGHLRFAEKK